MFFKRHKLNLLALIVGMASVLMAAQHTSARTAADKILWDHDKHS